MATTKKAPRATKETEAEPKTRNRDKFMEAGLSLGRARRDHAKLTARVSSLEHKLGNAEAQLAEAQDAVKAATELLTSAE